MTRYQIEFRPDGGEPEVAGTADATLAALDLLDAIAARLAGEGRVGWLVLVNQYLDPQHVVASRRIGGGGHTG